MLVECNRFPNIRIHIVKAVPIASFVQTVEEGEQPKPGTKFGLSSPSQSSLNWNELESVTREAHLLLVLVNNCIL